MFDHETIRAVCANLDPTNDGHWTSQGLPRMDVLSSMGLTIERRELNEALPGFNRTKAAEARAASPDLALAASGASPTREPTYEDLCSQHLVERARRRQAALEHLAKGGFTPKDLDPVRSRLEQRLTAQNRATRRGFN